MKRNSGTEEERSHREILNKRSKEQAREEREELEGICSRRNEG